ncbi:MAG: helix-turn-helix domain-containing protein [Acutalibacteraceae bacterium]|nr:helix-turn-helix domain-containing protein [Acutalibacteraceae bacterium]
MSFKDEFIKILGDTSIYSLYKITGIERTKLQRIKNGQRLPSNEDIEKISRALSLTVFEKKRLYQALEIETIGEDKYKSRGCTKQFLEDLFYVFQNSTD